MYKVVLYSENSVTSQAIKVIVKGEKVLKDENGLLFFSNMGKTIAGFNRGSWMYWEEIDEEV